MDMAKEAVLRACKAAGGQTALASALALKSQGSISRWVATGRVPAERVLAIEALTGVSRHELRPDLYPLEPAKRLTSAKDLTAA